jgi:hypothetical protein
MHRTFVTYKTEANAVMPSPEEAFDFMDNTLNLVAGKTILQSKISARISEPQKSLQVNTIRISKDMMTRPDLQWFQLKASAAPYQEQATVKNSNIIEFL